MWRRLTTAITFISTAKIEFDVYRAFHSPDIKLPLRDITRIATPDIQCTFASGFPLNKCIQTSLSGLLSSKVMEKNGLRSRSPEKYKKALALQIPPGSDSQIISVLLSLPEYSLETTGKNIKRNLQTHLFNVCRYIFQTDID